jgi:hypothetical protein
MSKLRELILCVLLAAPALWPADCQAAAAIPYFPATQTEVNAGANKTKAVTPFTLHGWLTNLVGGTVTNSGGSLIDATDLAVATIYTNTTGSNLLVIVGFQASVSSNYMALYIDQDKDGTYETKLPRRIAYNPPDTNQIYQITGVIDPDGRYTLTNLNSGAYNPGTIVVASCQRFYFSVGGSSGISGIATAGNTIWVDPNGNDSNPGTLSFPKLTIAGAKSIASVGDTIVVQPGTYAENNLLKKGVNYFGFPGANIVYFQTTTNDAGYGIFDDRPVGATTNVIVWPGRIELFGVTNVDFYDLVTDDGSYNFNPNTLGAIVITNPLSRYDTDIGAVGFGTFSGVPSETAGLYVAHNNNSIFKIGRIYDPLRGVEESAGLGTFTSVTMSGITSQLGSFDLHCDYLAGQNYAWHWFEPPGLTNASGIGTNVVDVRLYLGFVTNHIYGTCYSPNYRGWVKGIEQNVPDTSGAAGVCIGVYGGGKWYFDFLKIRSPGGIVFQTVLAGTVSNSVNWLTAQKISTGGSGWIDCAAGVNFIKVDTYEDTAGAIGNGIINRTGSDLTIADGTTMTNASGRALWHVGGTTRLKDFNAYSTNRENVFVSAPGLQIQNCVLVSGGTNCVNATNAQTVLFYGVTMSNKTNNNTVTVGAGGTFTQNASVR